MYNHNKNGISIKGQATHPMEFFSDGQNFKRFMSYNKQLNDYCPKHGMISIPWNNNKMLKLPIKQKILIEPKKKKKIQLVCMDKI